jgi:hypothetical protein
MTVETPSFMGIAREVDEAVGERRRVGALRAGGDGKPAGPGWNRQQHFLQKQSHHFRASHQYFSQVRQSEFMERAMTSSSPK